MSSCGSAPVGVVAAEIYGGSVDKNTLRFTCKSGEDGREITFQGRHNANEIEFTYEQQARNGAALSTLTADGAGMFGPSAVPRFVAKRVKPAGEEFAAAINLPLKNVKVEGTVFCPRLKLGRYARFWCSSTRAPDGMEWRRVWTADPALRALSAEIDSSLLLLRITNVSQTAFMNVIANAAAGADDGLLRLLDRLALESGRPELATAPLVLWGHSRSSNFVATFTSIHPERTIAFVRYHAGDLTLSPNMTILSRVPALLLDAGRNRFSRAPTLRAHGKMLAHSGRRGRSVSSQTRRTRIRPT